MNQRTAQSASGTIPIDDHDTLRAIVDHLQAGVVLHGPDSAILYANETAAKLLGWERMSLIGVQSHDERWRFVRQDLTAMPTEELPVTRVLRGDLVQHLVVGLRGGVDGETVWVMCNAFTVENFRTGDLLAVVTFTNISELTHATRALVTSEERLRLVVQGGNDAAFDRNLKTGVVFRAPRMWEILGYDPEHPLETPEPFIDALHPDDKERALNEYQAALDSDQSTLSTEYRLRHKDGFYVPIRFKGFISRDSHGKAIRVSGTISDLTEQKLYEEEIYRLGFFDSLTTLPNRRQMNEKLHHVLTDTARTRVFGALLIVDLDNFKDINDTLGHGVGDDLLCQVAERLRETISESDLAARYGGDEFVVLIQRSSDTLAEAANAGETLAVDILASLCQPYQLGGLSRATTASIGISLYDGSSEDVETLIKQADLALYKAKELGRNTFKFFNQSMQDSVDQRYAMEEALRKSVSGGEMLVHYQAQVSRDGKVAGAEVLLRWHPPGRPPIMPTQFIPLAESTGLIEPIGLFALRQACRQLASWHDDPQFACLTLSINVSVRQLNDPGFVKKVLEAIRDTGANPKLIKLEITETLLADRFEDIVQKMEELGDHGIHFSLDDFGVGYSSLQYLQKLPLKELKIDRGFTAEIESNNHTIPRIILSLGKELDLHVVAEGVENERQFQFLREHGCETFQGYFFGKPCPVEEFETLVRKLDAAGNEFV